MTMKRITHAQDTARKAVVELRRLRGEVTPMMTVGDRSELDPKKAHALVVKDEVWDYKSCKSCGYLSCSCAITYRVPPVTHSRMSDLMTHAQKAAMDELRGKYYVPVAQQPNDFWQAVISPSLVQAMEPGLTNNLNKKRLARGGK